MNIAIRKQFTDNSSFMGLPNVAVLVNGECNHASAEEISSETTAFYGGEDVSYSSTTTICPKCKAYQDMDGRWVGGDE